jgi:hypothetical protein
VRNSFGIFIGLSNNVHHFLLSPFDEQSDVRLVPNAVIVKRALQQIIWTIGTPPSPGAFSRRSSGRVAMTNLHDTSDRDRNAKIDAVGWLFAAFTVIVVGMAAIVAYEGTYASIAASNVPQVARPSG